MKKVLFISTVALAVIAVIAAVFSVSRVKLRVVEDGELDMDTVTDNCC